MNVHEKINARQSEVIRHYFESGIWFDYKVMQRKLRIPKNMTYCGFRNTCYDFTRRF